MLVKHKTHIGAREIWLSDSWDEYAYLCLKHGEHFASKKMGTAGQSFGSFVWVSSFKNLPVVVHEIIHAVDSWMEDIGISNDTEVRAYIVESILRSVLEKTQTKNKGKK